MKPFVKTVLLVLALCHITCLAGAQDLSADEDGLNRRIVSLEMLMRSIANVSGEIEKLQGVLQGTGGIGREQELRERINALSIKKDDLEATFNQLATNVETGKVDDEKKTGLDLKQEMKELLSPAVRELKKLTAGPREIERLRNQVETYEAQLPRIQNAMAHIDLLLARVENEALAEKLNQMRRQWKSRQDEIETRMHIAGGRLDRHLGERKSFSESAREIMRIFFRSRGRNLLLSLLAFVLTWIVFFYLHKPIRRFSPIHQEKRSFYTRLFDIAYYSCAILFSVFALLAVLYFSGDWVLLSIAAIFLLGIGWASKQALPLVWQQAKLMLNIGPVREGEVLVVRGLPYEVMAINLYTQMVNPLLAGGTLRLPIKDLLDLRSRPPAEHEPWFPCQPEEWVKMSDGTHGKVRVQTPEMVKMELLGGAVASYRTLTFLSLSPVNLSSGFRLWVTFRLDYSHRTEITSELPDIFEKEMPDGLADMGYGAVTRKIAVQFKTAGPSSLDLEIMADFSGAAAPDFDILKRVLARVCVDISNRYDWIVPLRQVRVHLKNDNI